VRRSCGVVYAAGSSLPMFPRPAVLAGVRRARTARGDAPAPPRPYEATRSGVARWSAMSSACVYAQGCCDRCCRRDSSRAAEVVAWVAEAECTTPSRWRAGRKRQRQQADKARLPMTRPADGSNKTGQQTRPPGLICLTARSPDKQGASNRAFPGLARRRDRASPFHCARLLWAPSLAWSEGLRGPA
jgi:hypothetical protein